MVFKFRNSKKMKGNGAELLVEGGFIKTQKIIVSKV
jgi:hypothetical protein